MILVDTSSWIEALRSQGNPEVRERVRQLMMDGRAAWCDLVLLELWNGARGEYERSKLAELERDIMRLPTTDAVWEKARILARSCRISGKAIPATDLVIVSCALVNGAELEHCDEHFGVILQVDSGCGTES